MTGHIDTEVFTDLPTDLELVEKIEEVLDRVTESDGVAPLGEAFLRGLREDRGHTHVVAFEKGEVVGVLAIDSDRVVELAVLPSRRHAGIATRLFQALKQSAGFSGVVDVWAHGDGSEAQRFVATLDARRTRELLKMAVSCPPGSPRANEFAMMAERARKSLTGSGIKVLNYAEASEKFGVDHVDEEWVRVNNEAFAWHPEQGGWSVEHLRREKDTGWFDPDGVLMLWIDDENPECMGFHWTKIPLAEREKDEGQRVGEVYVVCLADAARGRKLGGPVTLVGMDYLMDRGVGEIELYVEGDNAPAVSTYGKLGFSVVHTDVVYRGQL
ncbi:mycothiol synthase [Corynebacterium sp. HMSC28B08]|uniref:mycothiol synthase n=1 Tax=Corynebacterium sp. HMSC28B08 TaxID=1581066 RepID=UPI0008A654EA|nr:mycothiol synthase [Corynebacterium sp. HMSC28B08]OFT87837.1 mycothiol synthase [Corynebacterium sp. HMSC28B08]